MQEYMVFEGKRYQLSPTASRNKREAQSLARDIRRKGYNARVVGSEGIGWFVYRRRK